MMSDDAGVLSLKRRPLLRASALIVRGDEVLLVKQSKDGVEYWLLPGGAVERGEAITEAVRREVGEETGYKVRVLEPPIGLIESISPDQGRSRHLVHLVYYCRLEAAPSTEPATGTAHVDPTILESKWWSRARLPELVIHPPIHDLLNEWLEYLSVLESQGEEVLPQNLPPLVSTGPRWV